MELNFGELDPRYDQSAITKPVSVPRSLAESEPEVLVKFRPGISLERVKRLAAGFNDRVEDEIESVNGLVAIDDLDNADAASVARQYGRLGDLVVYAEPNFRIKLDPTTVTEVAETRAPRSGVLPNDPMFNEQWALNNDGNNGGKEKADIGALKAWLRTKGSEEVVVAVLDSGVDYSHPDLMENIWHRPDSVPAYTDDELGTIDDRNGFNSAENASDPMDDNGHGTHCAGIIGAEGNNGIGIAGINWKVRIMPLKFIGKGGFGSTKNAIEAINYAIDRKKAGVNVRVINASWGSTLYSKALEDAIRAAGEQGILFVAAAGNNGTDNDQRPHYPSNYDLPNVISVAALDRADQLTSFSNFGVRTVQIAAPGKDIFSTWLNDAYREASGTSMAAPQVAGVAALIVSSNPKINVEELRRRLLKSTDSLAWLKDKVESGGRLDAGKALSDE
jgi:thermitase